MTESQWDACNDPVQMLEFLRGKRRNRKFRLLASAFCRVLGEALKLEPCTRAAAHAERYADQVSSRRELRQVEEQLQIQASDLAWGRAGLTDKWERATSIARWTVSGRSADSAEYVAKEAAEEDKPIFLLLLRDIMGSPFHTPGIRSEWVVSNGRNASRMAQAIYDEYMFGDVPILADALEDAGCDNADILNHLRGPGPHVRGCWALDLLLGKE